MNARSRAEAVYQRLAGRLSAALPAPPELGLLSPLRARLGAELVEVHAASIAAVRQGWLDGVAAGDTEGPGRALGSLAERLVGELRARLAEELRSGSGSGGAAGTALRRLAGTADSWLATDEEEHLDHPDFDEAHRTRELRTIDRLNRGFGSYARFAEALAPLCAGQGPLTVLDIASGHGGFPLALALLWSGRRPRPRLIASDLRAEYLALGRAEAARRGLDGPRGVEFRVVDALSLERHFAPGEIDVITCTQSLHHFGAAGAARLLASAVGQARRGVLFLDLLRAGTATLAASALAALSRDAELAHDSVLSFRKAFVPEELALLAACVPGGERLEALFLPPAFTALRTRS